MNKPILLSSLSVPITLFSSKVHAGFVSPATDYAQGTIDLNDMLIKNKEATYLFEVEGQSMYDVGIYEGDKLIVDRMLTPAHNKIVLAQVDDGYCVRRLYKRGGVFKLLSENKAYAPLEFREGQEVSVWGVVTFNLHSLMRV